MQRRAIAVHRKIIARYPGIRVGGWLALALTVGGCGGDPATASVFSRTVPEQCNWSRPIVNSPDETNDDGSKTLVRAQVAYDLKLTGYCVPVVVVDSGLNSDAHEELPRYRVRAERYVNEPSEFSDGSLLGSLGLAKSFHSTAISGIIAAEANGRGMHGIAPGARIQVFTVLIDEEDSSIELGPDSPADNLYSGWLDYGRNNGLITNISLGPGTASAISAEEPQFTETQIRFVFPLTIAAGEQKDLHPDERTIFVWAAGNERSDISVPIEHTDSPILLSALPALVPSLRGHWLSVVAVGQTGEIADFSNRCGIARQWCLAAPGVCIRAPSSYSEGGGTANSLLFTPSCLVYDGSDPDFLALQGTSFSAPIVSGALALMMERFRGQLGHTAVVARMLATANKRGIYANSAIYGQGLLDIGAAVQPVGGVGLPLGDGRVSLGDLRPRLRDDTGLLSLMADALANAEVMLTDELGAPFWQPFDTLPGAVAVPPLPVRAVVGALPEQRLGTWRQTVVQSRDARGRAAYGYVLDNRFNSEHRLSRSYGGGGRAAYGYSAGSGGQGWFLALGAPAHWLTGLGAAGFGPGSFSDPAAFAAPATRLIAEQTQGGGLTVRLGRGHGSVALFSGRATSGADDAEPNRLMLMEYRRDNVHNHWVLQGGLVDESATWQGLDTAGSLYGSFSGRTAYGSLSVAQALSPTGSWHLLGSLYGSRMRARPLAAGLVSDIRLLAETQLELGLLGRALLHPGDSLSLRVWEHRYSIQGRWRLPVGLFRGEVVFAEPDLALAASGRRHAELGYRLPLSPKAVLSLRLGRTRMPLLADNYAAVHWHLGF